MKNILSIFFLMIILATTACIPQSVSTPSPLPATESATVFVPPTEIVQLPEDLKLYRNDVFGMAFQYPSSWLGPEEYISEQTLRVEVGSDVVYPYGTGPDERTYTLTNSYYVVIQYSKNDQNTYWRETYQSLLNLADGESLSDGRGLTIRVRQFTVGRFSGIEYISTLSEAAQTSPAYSRSVILFDEQSNVLTMMGQPNNVEVVGGNWREAYRMVDEANLSIFHEILGSISIQ